VWDLTANACSCELVPEVGTAVRSLTVALDGSLVVAANNAGAPALRPAGQAAAGAGVWAGRRVVRRPSGRAASRSTFWFSGCKRVSAKSSAGAPPCGHWQLQRGADPL